MASSPMLHVSQLCATYGAVTAVSDVSLEVSTGQLVALIGSNGAGKSTTLNTVSGLHKPKSGTVTLDGVDITGWPSHKVTRAGLALVPEGRLVAAPLTVEENLFLCRYAGRHDQASFRAAMERVFTLFPRLADRRRQLAGSLSGGEQQMLALGRALMTNPKIFVLDEPSMGLAPSVVDAVFQTIVALHRDGATVLLVEQNAELALTVADHVYVLNRGQIVSDGSPAQMRDRPETLAALLG